MVFVQMLQKTVLIFKRLISAAAILSSTKTTIMKKIISLFIVAGLFIFSRCLAQNQIFIKAIGSTGGSPATGIFDGGSTDERHQHEIEAYAYSDGLAGCANLSSGGGGGSACKISKTPFSFSMPLSFATISFKYNLLAGRHLTSVDMVIRKNGGRDQVEFYKVHMETVQVVSISEGASVESPIFNIELQPQKIAWQVIQQSTDGAAGDKFSYGWDFSANKPFAYVFP
jgi:type VI secretion system secreted protein Hcp